MNKAPLNKKALRALQREISEDLPTTEFVRAGRLIAHHISLWLNNHEPKLQQRRVALFRSMRDELNTEDLRAMLVEQGIEPCYPEPSRDPFIRFFMRKDGNLTEYSLDEMDIVFVPGRAFDRAGRRLGRGQGCYDRTLAVVKDLSSCPLFIGLALDSQIIDQVPVEPHDVLMHFICTPSLGMLQTSE